MSPVRDHRRWAERRVRRAWRHGASPPLEAASILFGVAVDARRFLFDVGLAAPAAPAVPVVSVGGLTVGGSGKTPLASEVAGLLEEIGMRPALVTRGFSDELEVHGRERPGRLVVGGVDRRGAVARAAREGADVAVLDDGFQHLPLARTLDVVAADADAILAGSARRLPAGPSRDRLAECGRADAVVLLRREADAGEARRLARYLSVRTPGAPVARLRLAPGGLRAANAAARESRRISPRVAVASIMKPEVFFRQLARLGVDPPERHVFPDHHVLEGRDIDRLLSRAGDRGIVGTLKDVVKLEGPGGPRIPLWYLEDRPLWEAGREEIGSLLRDVLPGARRGARRPPAPDSARERSPTRNPRTAGAGGGDGR